MGIGVGNLIGAGKEPIRSTGDALANMGAILFGRWIYEDFYAFWPNQPDNPFTTFFNNIQKYVASTTLEEPLAWRNATLLKGELAKAVGKLKEAQDKDIVVFGSGVLIQSLMRYNLVNEYVLLIHPLVLGSGHRLFTDGGTFAALRLINSKTTTTGVMIATYPPADSSESVT
jgi:dihydrofolate reductase